MSFTDVGPENKLLHLQEAYEAKGHTFYAERQRKEEEMKHMLVWWVKEKETIMKEAERELQTKVEHLKRVHQEEKMKFEEKTFARRNNLSLKRKPPLRYTRTTPLWQQVATWRTRTARTPILCKTKVPDHRRSSQAKLLKCWEYGVIFLLFYICCVIYSVFGQWPQLLLFMEKCF